MRRIVASVVAMVLAASGSAQAQVPADVWRGVAEKIEVGTEINVRLRDGQRVRAILVAARADALLIQPKTRQAVPVQAVPYEEIVSLERRSGGMSAGKAAAIGVVSGVGAFFAIMLILVATLD